MRRRAQWLALGVLSLAAGAVTYAALVRTVVGQTFDEWAGGVIRTLAPGAFGDALSALARPGAIIVLAFAFLLLLPWALATGRWLAAAAALIVALVCGPLALELRTTVLSRPDLGVGGYSTNTFPSTHAAAAFSLIVASIIAWPTRVGRKTLFWAGCLGLLAGAGNVTSYAHRPADVLGAFLLVAGVSGVVIAATGVTLDDRRERD